MSTLLLRLSSGSGPFALQAIGAERLFRFFLLLHVALWTVVPILVHGNPPLDVIEGMAWGRAWELGYPKGPPVFAWILGLLDPLPPQLRLAAVFAISQGAIALTFFGVWKLANRLYAPAHALFAVLLLEGVFYFGFPTPELNEIVLQMPVMALLGWIFHRAIREDRTRDWLLVGALAALGMWTRYSSAMLLLSLGLFLLLPANQSWFRRRGPWLALAALLLLWSPHLAWIVETDFQSIHYVGSRARAMTDAVDHIRIPLQFALSQLAALTPAILLSGLLVWRGRGITRERVLRVATSDRLYVFIIALGPFLLSEALSVGTSLGLRSMWGAPLWCFAGLLLVDLLRPVASLDNLRRFVVAWSLAFAVPVAAYIVTHAFRPALTTIEKRSSFPGRPLAQAVTDAWREANPDGQPLQYVVGTMWLAGNVAFHSSDRPLVFQDADPTASPWIDEQALKDAGAVILWSAGNNRHEMPAALRARFPDAVAQPVLQLPRRGWLTKGVSEIGWAVLLPSVDPTEPDMVDDVD